MAVTTSVAGATKTILHGGKGPLLEFTKNTKVYEVHILYMIVTLCNCNRRLSTFEQYGWQVVTNWTMWLLHDTRTLHNGPFELLFGREFKLSVWEEWVKGMLLEVARFTCPFKVNFH